ncbi:hypothetical protein SLS53_007513 [Cytospora paraplurivora]|uniref:Uncharacterized protein n=1 Tax=Cytospora paraplurivora TaxID=2898453 RepID=A0AAN9U826_9PEZI
MVAMKRTILVARVPSDVAPGVESILLERAAAKKKFKTSAKTTAATTSTKATLASSTTLAKVTTTPKVAASTTSSSTGTSSGTSSGTVSATSSSALLEFTKYPDTNPTWKNTGKPAWTTASSTPTATIAKRAVQTAFEGSLAQGGPDDTVFTYHFINCIAISAVDTGTGKKVLAHINAINTHDQDYSKQFEAFADIVNKFSVTPEITIRMPVVDDFTTLSTGARAQQTTMQNSIRDWAVELVGGTGSTHANVAVKPRTEYQGNMRINKDNSVDVDY